MSTIPSNYPEEYTRGTVHFFGRDFIVTPDVLIPRLETECLIKRARQILSSSNQTNVSIVDSHPATKNQKPKTIVIDIGCGSGIIGTSIADLVDEVIFLDISEAALDISKQNYQTHFPDNKAQYIVSDLLSHLPISQSTHLLFLINLPYIKDEDWKHMSEDTHFEPKLALFGGKKTGFELYERLFEQLYALSLVSASCVFEFGFDQRRIVEEVLKKYPHWKCEYFSDYAGIERFGEITI